MKNKILIVIIFLQLSSQSFYAQDIADFTPVSFVEIEWEALNKMFNEIEKNSLDYLTTVKFDTIIIARDSFRVNNFVRLLKNSYRNLTSVRKLLIVKNDFMEIFTEQEIRNEKALRDYVKDIMQLFDNVIDSYNNKVIIRADLGNTDGENVSESISPSLNFSYFYVLKRDESLDAIKSNFGQKLYATIGVNLNINGQSNFNLDSLAELTKLLNYASDINLYLNAKSGYGGDRDPVKIVLGVNGGISYYKKRNVDDVQVGGKSLIFTNGYLGFWVKIPKLFELLLGGKVEYRTFITKVQDSYKFSGLNNETTLNFYCSINIAEQFGIILNYLIFPKDLSSAERLQIKLSKAFSLAKF